MARVILFRGPAAMVARLTGKQLSDMMSDMKQVNARDFQKGFSKVAEGLAQGQTIAVTKRGKPLGFFTKAPGKASVAMPDFAANVGKMSYSLNAVEGILREVLDEPVP